jgi:hypothetical protein
MNRKVFRLALIATASLVFTRPASLIAAPALDAGQIAKVRAQAEAIQPTVLNPVNYADKEQASEMGPLIARYMSIPAEQVTAHPIAADFPGAVADDVPQIKRQFDFPLNLPRWQSTGLYAAPGAKITVRVSPEDAGRGLSVVIGSHTDSLVNHPKWVRFPRISRRFEITKAVTLAANAFGGLVYIDMPRDPRLGGYHFLTYGGYGWLDEHPSAVQGHAHVTIEGAVEAPLYRLGKTTAADWARQRKLTTPWGELASDKIILTVRTSTLTSLDDPSDLLKYWGKVIDTEADLAGWPKQPDPPERIVLDREISAGFMHSAYPIMAHLPSARSLLNLETLKTKGDWGFFHELGHNHEGQAYTFGGDYIEVDVNLFSMYVMQKVVGREMTAHPSLAHIDKVLEQRLGPAKKSDAWGNLAMYVKTIQAFGWEPLQKTLKSYALPGGADGIKTREEKMDQWILRYSKATGKNLIDYYAPFDVTCSPATREALKSLPTWVPEGFPEKYTGKQ